VVIHLSLDEKDRHLFKADLSGTVKVAFSPQRKLRARLTKVSPLPASPGKYDATVALETGPYAALMPGMACTAHFVLYSKKEAIAVPSKAVHEEDDKYFVYVVPKNGKEEKREVTPGRADDEQTEIISGLREGDEIRLERPGPKEAGKKGPAPEKKEGGDR
jgi:HlyD family secretion protein